MSNKLKVSVIASTFKDEGLFNSLKSLKNQTFKDFEIILVVDSPLEENKIKEIIYKLNLDNIVLIINEKNMGLTKSLNKAYSIALGEIIVRHDCDDISLSNRLEEIVNYFQNNNSEILCSYAYENNINKIIEIPDEVEVLKILPYRNCLIHPALAFKKDIISKFDRNNIYNESFLYSQDYELYLYCINIGLKFDILKKPLIIKIFTDNCITIKKRKQQLLYELAAKSLYLANTKNTSSFKILLPTVIRLLIPKILRNIKRSFK